MPCFCHPFSACLMSEASLPAFHPTPPHPHGGCYHGRASLAKFLVFSPNWLPTQAQVKHAGPQTGRKWGESSVAENLCP